MLVEHVRLVYKTTGYGGPVGSMEWPEANAFLEASLIHVRLLADFLENRGVQNDDVKACWWVNWSGSTCLRSSIREQINKRLVHLSSTRSTQRDWGLDLLAHGLCSELVKFFAAVASQCPDRLASFTCLCGDAPTFALAGLHEFAPARQ